MYTRALFHIRMRYIWWTAIAMGLVSPNPHTDFSFLLESGPTTVMLGVKESEVTLLLPVTFTTETVKESLAIITAVYNQWIKLGFWADTELALTYKKALETGKGSFLEGNKVFDQLMNYLNSTELVTPPDSCLLSIPFMDGGNLVQGGSFLKQKIGQITPTWAPAEAKNQRNTLDLFVLAFNSIGKEFLETVKESLKTTELILGKVFPPEFLGPLESLECITKAELEQVNVGDCMMGSNLVLCSLEVLTPTTPLTIKLLEPINNMGIELYLEPTQLLVQDTDNGRLYTLNCSMEINQEVSPFKLCRDMDDANEACHAALLLEDVENAIKQCRFCYAKAKRPFKLLNDGILIQTLDFTILNGENLVKQIPPLVIYSNELVKVTKQSEQYLFRLMVPLEEVGVYKTKLTAGQMYALSMKAMWDEFYYNFQLVNYLEHMALILQLIFAPLTIAGVIFSIKNWKTQKSRTAREKNCKIRKGKHKELRAFLRSEQL